MAHFRADATGQTLPLLWITFALAFSRDTAIGIVALGDDESRSKKSVHDKVKTLSTKLNHAR